MGALPRTPAGGNAGLHAGPTSGPGLKTAGRRSQGKGPTGHRLLAETIAKRSSKGYLLQSQVKNGELVAADSDARYETLAEFVDDLQDGGR
jgi:hypothetical protein